MKEGVNSRFKTRRLLSASQTHFLSFFHSVFLPNLCLSTYLYKLPKIANPALLNRISPLMNSSIVVLLNLIILFTLFLPSAKLDFVNLGPIPDTSDKGTPSMLEITGGDDNDSVSAKVHQGAGASAYRMMDVEIRGG